MSLTLVIYQDQNGNEPFEKWLSKIKDKTTESRIRSFLRRIEQDGLLGDVRPLKNGVSEFRRDFGPGYRIYFGRLGKDTILLLGGGHKNSQDRDIIRAKEGWKEHKSRNKRRQKFTKSGRWTGKSKSRLERIHIKELENA